MKEFLLIFKNSTNPASAPSPDQMQEMMNAWINWMGNIAAQDKLIDRGNRLSRTDARLLKPDQVITDGPYTEIKEFISGYTLIRSQTIEEAVAIAEGCPVLKVGGQVEVRAIIGMDDNS